MSSPPEKSYRQEFVIRIESTGSIDFEGQTESAHAIAPNQPYPYYVGTNETRRSIGDKVQNDTVKAFADKVLSEAAANGIEVYNVEATIKQYHWVETNRYTAYIIPMTPITIYSEKYTLDMTVSVLSDKPFAQSPMPLWVMQIIKWAISAVVYILIAYFAIQAFQACFNSLFVKTQTVKVYNPDGTLREETTTSEPSWTSGILVVGGLVIAALIVVPIVLDKLKTRKNRAPARRRARK